MNSKFLGFFMLLISSVGCAVTDGNQEIADSPTELDEGADALASPLFPGIAYRRLERSSEGDAVRSNGRVMKRALHYSADALKYASPELRNDRALMNYAVYIDGNTFCFASEALRADGDLALEAMKNGNDVYRCLASSLKQQPELVALEISGLPNPVPFYKSMPAATQANETVATALVRRYGSLLRHTPMSLRSNRTVVYQAVTHGGRALMYAEPFQADLDMAYAAANDSSLALPSIAPELQNHPKIQFAIEMNRLDRVYDKPGAQPRLYDDALTWDTNANGELVMNESDILARTREIRSRSNSY